MTSADVPEQATPPPVEKPGPPAVSPPPNPPPAKGEDKDQTEADERWWVYLPSDDREYPFHLEDQEGDDETPPTRVVVKASHGDRRQWPEGPPNDGAWALEGEE